MPPTPSAAPDRPDVFLSYAREDTEFAERQLTRALVARGKDVWIDVEDIRGGAADWRASVWAGIEAATVMVFVLTPDSLASKVCGEELERATELNKRIVPVLRRPVEGLPMPPALERPNWIHALPDDDFEASLAALIDALELDEAWVEQHARLAQRTGEWLRNEQDGSYLLRGSDLGSAERWLDDQGSHTEQPTAQQVTYITASRRAAARRQRGLLAGVGVALVVTAVLAVLAFASRETAIEKEHTAQAQARAAQSLAALSRDPEESVRDALEAIDIRAGEPEARYALQRAVSIVGWTRLFRLPDSPAGLVDAELSDDGRRLATAGSDGEVAVWNTRSGQRVSRMRHPEAVNTVQFSPDHRTLLTASEDGTARTWVTATGRPLRRFDTRSAEAWAATWGDGGRRILTVGSRGGEVWDATRNTPPKRLANDGEYQGTIRMSVDGRRALTSGRAGRVRVWNAATGRQIGTLPGGHGPLAFSLLSRDGRRMATLYDSGTVCVWDEGRRRPRFCRAGGDDFFDADLSLDGRRVLRADRHRVVEVWDTATGLRIARLHSPGVVASAQFDRSGEHLVTGGDDGVARVWQVRPLRLVSVLRGHTDGIRRARFSADGLQVATASDDGSARLWPSGPRTPADPRWQRADSTTFAPGSRNVLVIRGTGRAVLDTRTLGIRPLPGGSMVLDTPSWPCGRAAGCAPWSPDGRFVTGATADGGAAVWTVRTGKMRRLGPATGSVVGAAFSPDGSRIVVVDGNAYQAQIRDAASGRLLGFAPRRHAADTLSSAQFVGGSNRVLTVDAAGGALLTDFAAGTTVPLGGETLPKAVAASGDGRRLGIGTTDGRLLVYSGAGTGERSRPVSDRSVSIVAFDRDGDTIATGGQKGTASTWDARTLTPTVLRAAGEVTGASFGPDGKLVLVTAGSTARLWDRTLPRVVVTLPQFGGIRGEISPDGSRIVLAGTTRLQVLRCDACAAPDELERRARSLLPPDS